jgi:hypothetical protein
MQEFTSAATSINRTKVPAVFGKVAKCGGFREGGINLDIGGGKFDTATEFLARHGVENFIYDPYNRTHEHNQASLEAAGFGQADTVTVSNVLNVIKEEYRRLGVLSLAQYATKLGGKVYITVYEGDKSGIARETSAGYQLNRKTAEYVAECSQVFGKVELVNGVIICSE